MKSSNVEKINFANFLLRLLKSAILIGGLISLVGCAAEKTNSNQNTNSSQPSGNLNVNNSNAANLSPEQTDKTLKKDARLQADADALLHFFDKMPSVPVYLKDVPILSGGTNVERGVAFTDCVEKKYPTIFIKKSFYDKNNRKQLVNILKHELTHAWLCRQGAMSGHDERFRKKFKEVGGFGN